MRAYLAVGLLSSVLACGHQAGTPIWRDILAQSAPCTAAPLDAPPSWISKTITSPSGNIRFPPAFRLGESPNARETVWFGPDSSVFVYVVTPQTGFTMYLQAPLRLLQRLREPSNRVEPPCRWSVDGHDAIIVISQYLDSSKVDTVFGLYATIFIRAQHYAQITAFSPTAAMRDSMIGVVASLRWQ
jgi:hypothetical protein